MASAKSVSDAKNLQRNKENILRAIEHLKVRKARPDPYRILYVLNKQFGMDVEDAKDALEQMTDEHRIVRVDYKGSVSYRDVKNWIRLSDNIEGVATLGGASILNSDRATAAIKDAVKILSSAKGSDASGSASLQDLEKYFKTHEKFTSAPTAVAVEREVNAGHLARKGPDAFVINTPKKSAKAPPPADRPSEPAAEANEAMNEHGKRVKKTKVIFDPSDVSRPVATETPPPKKFRRTPPSASPSGSKRRICRLCKNPSKHEVVLTCCSCLTFVHPSCMGYSRRLARQIQFSDWTCMDCKTCCLCTATGGELIFCDGCDQAFHMRCHKPEVKKKPVGEWMCVQCREGQTETPPAKLGRPPKNTPPGHTDKAGRGAGKPSPVKSRAKVSGTSGKPEAKPAVKSEPAQRAGAAKKASLQPGSKPAAKPAAAVPRKLSWPQQLMEAPVDESVPDAADWSADDVAAYLCRHGFQPHAAAFQKQVDGPSLLLMTRMDVLRGLGLKLGPALKIYNHVKLLQTRRRACLDFCLL